MLLQASGNNSQSALADSIRAVNNARIFPLAIRFHGLYAAKDPKATLAIHKKALKIAIQSGNELQQAGFQHRIALCLYRLEQADKALQYDTQSLQLFRKLNVNQGIAKALSSIGKHYLKQKNYPQAAIHLLQAYTAAKLNNEAIYINDVLDQLASLAHEQGDNASEIKYNKEAYLLSKQQNINADIVYFGMNLGNAYINNAQYDVALVHLEAIRQILEEANDKASLSKVYNNMGNAYIKQGNYASSLSCYLKSLELKEISSSPQDISQVLVNLGSLYFALEQYPKALEHYRNAFRIKQKLGDDIGMASIHSSMGVTYRNMGQTDNALQSYQKAVDIYRSKADNKRLAQTLNNMGVLYSENGNPDKALSLFDESLKLKGKLSDDNDHLSSYLNIIDISLNKRVDLAKAAKYLDMVKATPSLNTTPDKRVNYLSLAARYSELSKDYPASLRFYKAYSALQDSIYANRSSRQLAELDVQYGLSSKEKQIALLRENAELNKQNMAKSHLLRNYLIVILLLAAGLALILYSRYRTLKRFNKIILENDMKLQQLNQSLEQRVETEIAIRRQHEQKAFQQARLAALGEMAAGIAHELNQPLHSLAFTLDNILLYLKEEQAEPDYLNQKLDYLFDDISRMRKAIDHIRHFAKTKTDTEMQVFDVNEAILQTVSLIQNQYSKLGITIETGLQNDLPGVIGNPYKLEQVMLNLLSNSRDAIGMLPAAQRDKNHGTIRISSALLGDKLLIKCIDNGIGIPEALQDKIFQSFFSTKDPEHGTGLGLTISEGIINDMHGEISIRSTPHAGTTVSLILPKAETSDNVATIIQKRS
jgi:signal transduction histidine kinase/tetratricopeptide (TPR) repeat protein